MITATLPLWAIFPYYDVSYRKAVSRTLGIVGKFGLLKGQARHGLDMCLFILVLSLDLDMW